MYTFFQRKLKWKHCSRCAPAPNRTNPAAAAAPQHPPKRTQGSALQRFFKQQNCSAYGSRPDLIQRHPLITCNGDVRSISTSYLNLLIPFYHAKFLANIDIAPACPAFYARMKCPSIEATFHLIVIKGLKRVHKEKQKFLQNPIFLGPC